MLEFCPYGDISSFPEPISEIQSWCVCKQLVEGLSVLHKLDITHRDIKPEVFLPDRAPTKSLLTRLQNVLLVSEHPIRVKIADFGVSKLSPEGITQPRTQAGTNGYMAPECFAINNRTTESSYTHAVDIWSLGCLIYYLLTKEIPFDNGAFQALQNYCDGAIGFPEGPLIGHQVSLSGRYFIQRLLAPLAEDRPAASANLMMNWMVPPVLKDASHALNKVAISSSGVHPTTPSRDSVQSSSRASSHSTQELFDLPEPLGEDSNEISLQTRNENNMVGLTKYCSRVVSSQRQLTNKQDFQSSELWLLVKSENGSKSSNEKRLRNLLMFNASPNIHLKGYTALHVATEQGPVESVKMLLDFKADPEARTEPRQETPIHLASCQGNFETFSKKVNLLVEARADVDAQNFQGDTALHFAIIRIGTVDAVKALLQSAASTALKGRKEQTVLQLAISLDGEEIADTLLDHGADPNCVGQNGITPLHLAIRSSRISTKFLGRLIIAGADINKEDGNHHSPLYEAITFGRSDAIRLLLNHGAECRPYRKEVEWYRGQSALWQKFALWLQWLSE